MAFTVIQAGTSLQFMDTDGVLSSLTLPTGATLRDDVPPRWVVFGGYAILVNTPSFPLTIAPDGVVRPLCPKPPAVAPTVAIGTAGTLSGTYGGIRYTYLIKDDIGNIIAESDFSPPSNTVTLTNDKLQVSGVSVSPETSVNARRLYRPTTDGAVLFPWFDIEGNTITTAQDDLSDAGLEKPPLGYQRRRARPDLLQYARFSVCLARRQLYRYPWDGQRRLWYPRPHAQERSARDWASRHHLADHGYDRRRLPSR
jgi:hypothetical protein